MSVRIKFVNMELLDAKLIHVLTGNIGVCVKEFRNYYGDAILIKLDDGREYYAPKREFKNYITGEWI